MRRAASSTRIDWWDAPEALHQAVASFAGAPVTDAATQAGGFSDGIAARLRLADGTRVFVKGVPTTGRRSTVTLYDREASVLSRLPPGLPAPRFIGRLDAAGWMLLVLEDVEGHTPAVPWSARDLDGVTRTLARMTDMYATAGREAGLEPWGGTDAVWDGWAEVFASPDADDVGPLARRHADALLELESACTGASRGDALLHSDLRSDNIVLSEEMGTVFVDWAWAAHGAAWLDGVILAIACAAQGMPEPELVFRTQPSASSTDPDAVDTVLAALAGRFLCASRWSLEEGLVALHHYQVAEARATTSWLARRRGWV